MLLRLGLLTSLLVFASCEKGRKEASLSNGSKSMYCMLSKGNIQHRLYQPDEVNEAPHPFYKGRKDDPIYSYKNACGFASLNYDPVNDELHYALSYSGLSGTPIMIHFHLGDASEEGPIIQTIIGEPYSEVPGLGSSEAPPLNGKNVPAGRAGFLTGVYKLKGNSHLKQPLSLEEERRELMDGNIYINVHTYLNENGEVRGQIYRCE